MKKEIFRRMTRQRRLILEELRKVRTHPTADSIFRMVKRRFSSISFGTVYRNLKILEQQGQILELTCGKYSSRYDGNPKNHYHFFCIGCKNVFDIDSPILEDLDKRIGRKAGMDVRYHRITFYGYCKDCRDKKGGLYG